MNILICSDSFKDSLSSGEISNIIRQNIQKKFPTAEINCTEVADGGEGSLLALQKTGVFELVNHECLNALLRPINTSFLWSDANKHALVELAQTCGLDQLKRDERNCFNTSTYGLGQQIYEVLKLRPKLVDVFIGGSATNDLGIGMAASLTHDFYSEGKKIVFPKGRDMLIVDRLVRKSMPQNDVSFRVICDVKNILLGEHGSTKTYGKQKGASNDELDLLEQGAKNILKLVDDNQNKNLHLKDGAGAAGGVGFGAMAFLDAQMISGAEHILETLGLDQKISEADLVITGEGKLDKQTLNGKLIKAISQKAKDHCKKTIAVCALNELSEKELNSLNLGKVYPLYSIAPERISRTDTINKLQEVCQQIMNDYIK